MGDFGGIFTGLLAVSEGRNAGLLFVEDRDDGWVFSLESVVLLVSP